MHLSEWLELEDSDGDKAKQNLEKLGQSCFLVGTSTGRVFRESSLAVSQKSNIRLPHDPTSQTPGHFSRRRDHSCLQHKPVI